MPFKSIMKIETVRAVSVESSKSEDQWSCKRSPDIVAL